MQRPQGRSARIRQQVHWAVIDLLRDRSADELSIPLVADRSGVHQATIYRRWGSIRSCSATSPPPGPPGPARFRTPARCAATWTSTPPASPMPSRPAGRANAPGGRSNIPPDPDRGPSAILAERTQQLQEMLDRAEARGELSPSVDELLELVVAPLTFMPC